MIAENIRYMDCTELSDDELRDVLGSSGGGYGTSGMMGAGGTGGMMGGAGNMSGAGACNTVGIGSMCGLMGNINLAPMQQAITGCGAALAPAPINPANFTLCLDPTY